MERIQMGISSEHLKAHYKQYFIGSLYFYPERYINLIFRHHSIIVPHVAYLCPLCITNWLYWSAEGELCSAEFTNDHYPAKNSCGNRTVLVCRSCNSKAGHDYDYSLAEHLDVLSYNARVPKSVMRMQHRPSGLAKYINGRIEIDNGGEMVLHFKKKESDKVKPVDEWLENQKKSNEWTFDIKAKDPDPTKVQKALLHAAYLFCFENFGYEFIFSKGGELIRDTLADKVEYPADLLDLNLDRPEFQTIIPAGLCFISYPIELRSFAVNIFLVNKDTGYKTIKTVLIPSPLSKGIETLAHQAKLLKGYIGDLSMVPLNNYLKAGYPKAYNKMWKDLHEKYITETEKK